jgi:hypothetical protein
MLVARLVVIFVTYTLATTAILSAAAGTNLRYTWELALGLREPCCQVDDRPQLNQWLPGPNLSQSECRRLGLHYVRLAAMPDRCE